jgi:hypothetical protein
MDTPMSDEEPSDAEGEHPPHTQVEDPPSPRADVTASPKKSWWRKRPTATQVMAAATVVAALAALISSMKGCSPF